MYFFDLKICADRVRISSNKHNTVLNKRINGR